MQIDDIVAARYRLIKQLQDSWLAARVDDGLLCVLKSDAAFVDPDVATWLGTVWHPGLPHYHETIKIDNHRAYHVFDYLPGQSLEQLARTIGGRIGSGQLLPVITEIAGILSFIHLQNNLPVLHLDIKPANVIVAADGQVGLIDFGAAIVVHDTGAERECRALTPEFAAPEQLTGHPTAASDVYALGLTMLVLLSGRNPADCRRVPPTDLLPDGEPWLVGILGRCLHADPDCRYQNAADLLRDLETRANRTASNAGIKQPAPVYTITDFEQHEPGSAAAGIEQPALSSATTGPDQAAPDSAAMRVEALECDEPVLPEKQAYLPSPLICIWDGADFGCELAAVLAETRQVIVIDADLLNPRADLLLGVQNTGDRLFHDDAAAGLDRAIMEEQRGHMNTILLDHLAQPTRIDRLRMLATQGNLDYFEHVQIESLHQIIKASRLIAEVVLILCNRSIYDAFTCLGLLEADCILIPLEADHGAFREINRAVRFMEIRHQLDRSRLHYVAFPYDPRVDLSRGTMNELCDGRLAGCVALSSRRRSMKSGARPYASSLDRDIQRDYLQLIQTIQILEPSGRILTKPVKLPRPGKLAVPGKLAMLGKPGKIGTLAKPGKRG